MVIPSASCANTLGANAMKSTIKNQRMIPPLVERNIAMVAGATQALLNRAVSLDASKIPNAPFTCRHTAELCDYERRADWAILHTSSLLSGKGCPNA